ncbi:MAG: hypothetical protein ACYTEZ_02680 [Planctomycetota bacterium]|jgi:hypothetical protein
MCLRAVGLLAVVALGCKGPYAPFDAGHPVHVVITAEPKPAKAIQIRPICTLGSLVQKSPGIHLGGPGPAGAEVALFRAPAGKHRLSVWEPRTWSGARTDVRVERELWVAMEIRKGQRTGRLRVFQTPPHDQIPPWKPLVAVPD